MVTKKIRTEYMKKFRDPKWETFSKCYEDSVQYRLSRRLMEHSHKPWIWEGWDGGSDCSGRSTPRPTRNRVAPLSLPLPPSSEGRLKTGPDPRTPPEQPDPGAGDTGAGDTGAGDTGAGDPGAGDTGAGDTGAGDPGAGDTGAGDPGAGDTGAGDTGAGDPGAGDTGAGDPGAGDTGAGDTGAGHAGAGHAGPRTENGGSVDIRGLSDGPADTPSSDGQPVNPPPRRRHRRRTSSSVSGDRDGSQDDKSAVLRKLPRAKSQPPDRTGRQTAVRRTPDDARRTSNLERRRARSADLEKMVRSRLMAVEDRWMTEYMRCFSARLFGPPEPRRLISREKR
ncbi:centriole, cilia and spindle-associated protein [Echeneis naucrates]|uniref:Centriole, cilia and spindle-associated protein-like n=1 Tax=Echeneis naucrates TaxID=173247 RepID=A0A665TYR7_ECHNA|nr:centriole, cilia and spindle-associated protein-like [Echeneis naucrates]XP_029351737.1 centriole, cilia and spindle-associated protein-like [Echeneis naucrates]XP_029351823.1 centriole, cilia and spindle-associated protein-like [Echeneis naucrates]